MTYDVTITSLPKTMRKLGPPRNQTNYKGNEESFPKMYFFIDIE